MKARDDILKKEKRFLTAFVHTLLEKTPVSGSGTLSEGTNMYI